MGVRVGRSWAAGVVTAGLLLVGVVYGCIWYAIPDRPIARDWAFYGPVLFGPYGLAAVGCWRSAGRPVRPLAAWVVLAGVVMAAGVVLDARPTFGGGPPPAVPASAFLSVPLLVGQYAAGAVAAVCGVAGWSPVRSAGRPAIHPGGRAP